MAGLAARWRRSNLVVLVALRKGNHPGEAYVRRGHRKDLYRRERDSIEESHEEAEIQRKALRRGKNLVFSEDTCLEKGKSAVEGDPKKSWMGLKRRREPSRRKLGWWLAWWGSTDKNEASHLLGSRRRH